MRCNINEGSHTAHEYKKPVLYEIRDNQKIHLFNLLSYKTVMYLFLFFRLYFAFFFQCEFQECEMKFKRRKERQEHQEDHEGDKPFK